MSSHQKTEGRMRYVFQRGVPGIYAEIYLPKKTGFQGPLYSALTEGRNPDIIRKHFASYKNRIKEILRKDWPQLESRLNDDFINTLADNIRDIYIGYSMYEVDGVFFSQGSEDPFEERTQVIRLMFEYKIRDEDSNELLTEIKRLLREPSSSVRESYKQTSAESKNGLDKVERWIEQVGAFLFGFVLHRIELAIEQAPQLKQEEIWLTSFWNLVINKFVPETRMVLSDSAS
jgi:hypothetical protein